MNKDDEEDEVKKFLFSLNRGRKMGNVNKGRLNYIIVWGKLGRALIPCPKIDVKFLSLNSSTLSPILTYHRFANFCRDSNMRIGNYWDDWIKIFPKLNKKIKRDKFRFRIQTDGIYASFSEESKFDEWSVKNVRKKKKKVVIYIFIHIFIINVFFRNLNRRQRSETRYQKKKKKKKRRRRRKKKKRWRRRKMRKRKRKRKRR